MTIKNMAVRLLAISSLFGFAAWLSACGSPASKSDTPGMGDVTLWPELESPIKKSAETEAQIDQWLTRMSLEQKVGQMIQAEIRSITPEEVGEYHIGSVLNGGGAFPSENKYSTVADWVALADRFYLESTLDKPGRLPIPILWGTDAVHGHNNVIGATIFPHNIGLGAANNSNLAYKIAQATAVEVAATGIDWTFAPTLAVVRDIRWGRSYEGYSQTPARVNAMAEAMVLGLQGQPEKLLEPGAVVATAKHFIADGGTARGDDQGDTVISEQELVDVHAPPYFSALNAGVQTVMVSYSAINGKKMHGSKYFINDVLKNRMGFDGFVISDWNGIGQVKGCANDSCAQAINAGIDMLMIPNKYDWRSIIANIISQVKSGEIEESRIDDAVRRILRVKIRAGIFERGKPSDRLYAGDTSVVGSDDHRAIARQAVRESLVMLKNKNSLLPLQPNKQILMVGSAANSIPNQAGGWSISWQGTGNSNSDFPGGTSIYSGVRQTLSDSGGAITLVEKADALASHLELQSDYSAAIIVVGDEPYAEYKGDIQNAETLEFQAGYKEGLELAKLLKKKNIPIIMVMLTGRPVWASAELNISDAVVVAWLPGTEGAGVADVLFTDNAGNIKYDFKGTLSFDWPASPCSTSYGESEPQFKMGYGATYRLSPVDPSIVDAGEVGMYGCALTPPPAEDWVITPPDMPVFYSHHSERYEAVSAGKAKRFDGADVANIDGAYTVRWSGEFDAKVAFGYGDKKNLLQSLIEDYSVQIDFSALDIREEKIMLGMECGMPCAAEIDVTDELSKLQVAESKRLQVPLSCFAEQKIDFEKVSAPLTFKSSSESSISVTSIRVGPRSDDALLANCE